MNQSACTVNIENEELLLLPERALFWKRKKTLLLSDLHLAKSGHFRKAGIPLPSSIHENDLSRLSKILDQFNVEKIYLLGDLFHSKQNSEWKQFERWRNKFDNIEMILVRGNHDRSEESEMREHGIDSVYAFVNEKPFFLTHEKKSAADESLYNISGHIHPGITLSGKGRQSKSFPCFWFSENFAVLPAFGNFTGHALIQPSWNDRVLIIFENKIQELNHL